MKETLTTADGRALAYRRLGAGPLLVCHPGGPGLSSRELGNLGGLDERLTLAVLDPRGTGGSDRAAGYALDDYVADVDELRAHLGVERVSLLGFSHGGMVAMGYASSRPARVDRLLLVVTLPRVGDVDHAALERHASEPWYEDARAALVAEDDGTYASDEELTEIVFRQFPLYFSRFGDRERAWLESSRELLNADALHGFAAEAPTLDLRPGLPLVEAPTLIVAGADDFICGPAVAAEIAAGIEGAETVVLPDCGHFPHVEQPDRFLEAVFAFMGVA